MAVIRKRLIFWLIKAYIKKSGKTILFSLPYLVSFAFFVLLLIAKYYSHIVPFSHSETIGLVGAYSQDSLPAEITGKISNGLTTISPDGNIKPGLASSWDVLNNGQIYRFHLKPGQHFSDGQEVTSATVNYNFSDVTEEKPDKYTVVFKLNDSYAPFLVTVSKPILDKGFSGVGDYRLVKLNVTYGFVQSLTLVSSKNEDDTINYIFFPSEDSLKLAFLLGEVSNAEAISSTSVDTINIKNFRNTTVVKSFNYSQLVTLFFNNDDNYLSNKDLRLALMSAIPDSFPEGQTAYLPYSPLSQYYNNNITKRSQDLDYAKELMKPSSTSSLSGKLNLPTNLTIQTFPKFHSDAEEIANAWNNLGIKTTVENVDSLPTQYQL